MKKATQRLCAWCKRDLDTGQQLTDDEYNKASKSATHGMCPECYDKEMKEHRSLKHEDI